MFISDSGDLFSIVVISSKKMVRCTFFKFNMFYVSFDDIVEDNNNLKRIYLLETFKKARQTCIVRWHKHAKILDFLQIRKLLFPKLASLLLFFFYICTSEWDLIMNFKTKDYWAN